MVRQRARGDHENRGIFTPVDTLTVGLGVVISVTGLFALAYTYRASTMVVLALGAALLFGGIVRVVHAVVHSDDEGTAHGVVTGVLHAVVGAMMLARPDSTMLSLTLLLGVLFFGGGFARVIGSVAMQRPGWGWELASGSVSLALGLLVLFNWPLTGLWLIGLLVGVELVTSGFAVFADGVRLHRMEHRVGSMAHAK